MTTELQVEVVTDTNVNYTEEALVPLLELPLVEDLNSNDRRFLDRTEWCKIDGFIAKRPQG